MTQEPTQTEREEALKFPNGYIYRIAEGFDPLGRVPPEAIKGAWKVDEAGQIIGVYLQRQIRPDPPTADLVG